MKYIIGAISGISAFVLWFVVFDFIDYVLRRKIKNRRGKKMKKAQCIKEENKRLKEILLEVSPFNSEGICACCRYDPMIHNDHKPTCEYLELVK